MPARKLQEFLDSNQIKYVTIRHSPAFTAQEIAETAHISGKELAKTVMVKVDDKMVMTVLPASHHIDAMLLIKAFGAMFVELANEKEFKDRFPDCEIGAMPPFGNLYDLEVYVAESLQDEKMIAFNAGSHTELIKMAYADFIRLVQPKIIRFDT
jgi:Ala-tRNA(Pro) deacylase